MVRSAPMTNVVRLTGSSRASRPRRRVCRPRREASRATDGSTQLGEPASAHPEQLGHHAVRVGEQRINERALLGEVGLLVDGVGADTHPMGDHPGEFVAQIPKMTSLGCTHIGEDANGKKNSTTGPSERSADSVRGRPVWSYKVKSGALSPAIIGKD